MKFLVCLFAAVALAASSDPSVLKCEFKSFGEGDYTCWIKDQDVLEGAEVTFDTTGHLEGKTNADVNRIYFKDTKLAFVPNGIFELFRFVETVDFEDVGLKQFKREYLHGTNEVKTLKFEDVSIEQLDDDSFAEVPHLRHLLIQGTKITTFSPELFKTTKLTELNIKFNDFSAGLPVGAFNHLSLTLEKLNLAANNLLTTSMPKDIFGPLTKLTHLVLLSNKLTDFDGSEYFPTAGHPFNIYVDEGIKVTGLSSNEVVKHVIDF